MGIPSGGFGFVPRDSLDLLSQSVLRTLAQGEVLAVNVAW
jgi:hypothetical protein